MKKMQRNVLRRLVIFVSVFVVASIFSINVFAADEVLEQVKSLIRTYYVYDVPQKALDAADINESVKALNDPYTKYFSPEEYNDFINSIDMKVSGIGINIELVPDGIKVINVMEGQPAEAAGIAAGDIIIIVDGHSMKGLTPFEAASYISGEEGTVVELVVKRGEKLLSFSITRKMIKVPTVTPNVLEGNIGYIEIASFGETTPKEFKDSLLYLKSKGVDGFIIDLRDNGGGYMYSAINIAEYFIGQRISLITEDKNGNKKEYSELDNGIEMDRPVIFLINENTASASEILSAAVKDYNRAFFIGKTTFGKGVAQSMFPLSNGGVLKLTTMKFYSPKGNIINKKGILPDLNTGDKDPLLAAELLLGKPKAVVDKRGFVKVSIGGRSFEIDINKAKKQEYCDSFKNILDLPLASIYIGTQWGWQSVKKDTDQYWNLYFSGHTPVNSIMNVPSDKKFLVTFSKEINFSTITTDTIKLIRGLNGEEIPVKFEFLNGKEVRVIPKLSLNPGEKYYLVIEKSIKGIKNIPMLRSTVTKVQVKSNAASASFIKRACAKMFLLKLWSYKWDYNINSSLIFKGSN